MCIICHTSDSKLLYTQETFVLAPQNIEMCIIGSSMLQTLPEKEARIIVAQIFQGLAHLNADGRKIIHYDLKPANILFDSMGRVKIAVRPSAKHLYTVLQHVATIDMSYTRNPCMLPDSIICSSNGIWCYDAFGVLDVDFKGNCGGLMKAK